MAKVIITGACGFIGCCLANRLTEMGIEVVGIDNLSRRGSEINAMEISSRKLFSLLRLDLSNTNKTFTAFSDIGPVDAVFHLAGQVAVTVSYVDHLLDFQDNAVASFNVIEAVRRYSPEAYCLYASTNKVYGHIKVAKPVGMDFPLNPYTPYGVSKAVGEMYFTEYGQPEIGLDTVSFRQSCIYGHHQFGVEDQGWLAWFGIANLLGRQITIYGDGEQVRDLLFVDDLVELYMQSWQKRLTGVYPVGGGEANAINLMQGLEAIEKTTGKVFKPYGFGEIRAGDQPYFVANLDWVKDTDLDWRPTVGVDEGLGHMMSWISERLNLVKKVLG